MKDSVRGSLAPGLAVVGAGGKTSTVKTLAAEFAASALKVGITHVITPRDTARLLQSCYQPKYVILNKADTLGLCPRGGNGRLSSRSTLRHHQSEEVWEV